MTILRPRLPVLTLLFTVALLLQPGPTPTATLTTVGAATPEDAVITLLSSFTVPGIAGGSCNALSGRFQGCPITPRLLARLQSATENGNIISRSQNPPQGLSVSPLDNDGQTAHVNTVWQFGASSYTITFTVIRVTGGWQVDDSFCAGQPSTSIFNLPTGPCPATSGPSTTPVTTPSTTAPTNPTAVATSTVQSAPTATVVVPGVPTTGSGGQLNPLLATLVVLALIATVTGFFLSLHSNASRPSTRN